MATIGWIKVGVTTDTSKFAKGMHESAKAVGELTEMIKRAAEAYIGWEAAKRIVETVKGTIETISQTKILAERVGMTAEAFGQLSAAAQLAHIDQDSLAISLEQMNKRLGEIAMTGEGKAVQALKRFGLTAQQVANMGTQKAFSTLVSVLESIKNPMERAAVAQEFFGKSGQSMINIAAMGSDKIKEVGAEASRLGTALNGVDTAKVEEADQAMIRLGQASQGFYNFAAATLAPFITELIERYLEWGYSGAKSASFVAQGLDWVVKGIGLAVDGVNLLKVAFYGVQSIISEMFSVFATGIDKMLSGIEWLVEKVSGVKVEFGDFFKNWSADLEKLSKTQAEAGIAAFGQIGKGGENVRKLVDDITGKANEKAKIAAGKTADFAKPGDINANKVQPAFAGGASELGSKEAYSTILRSIGMARGETEQKQIAKHTAATAEAANRSAALLEKIAGKKEDIKPVMPGAF